MTLRELAAKLRNEAGGGSIVIDNAMLDRTDFGILVKDDLGRNEQNVIINAEVWAIPRDPPPTGFSFPCTLPTNAPNSFLNLLAKECTAFFAQDTQDVIQFALQIKLLSGGTLSWKFGDTFPALLGLPGDAMGFTDPFLIFTTDLVIINQVTFAQGLNFSSPITLTGPYRIVEVLLEAAGVTPNPGSMSGLIQLGTTPTEAPTLDLKASLGVPSISLPLVDLLAAEIGYQLGTNEEGVDGTPLYVLLWIKGTVSLENDDGQQVDLETYGLLVAGPGNSNIVELLILPGDDFDTSLDNLGSLVGGQAWSTFFDGPAEVLRPFLATFGLRSYLLSLTLSPFAVTLSQFEVGSFEQWEIQPSLVMTEFRVSWLLLNPTSETPVNQLTVTGDLQMFGPENVFHAEIGIPDLNISGNLKSTLPTSTSEWLGTVTTGFGLTNLSADLIELLDSFQLENINFALQVGDVSTFTLECHGTLTVAGRAVGFLVAVDITGTETGTGFTYTYTVAASIKFGGNFLTAEVAKNPANQLEVTVTYDNDVNPIGLNDIAANLGYDDLGIPFGTNLDLAHFEFKYNFTTEKVVLTAASTNSNNATLVIFKPELSDDFILFGGLNLGSNISLSNLPLLGEALSTHASVEIRDLQILFTSEVLSEEQVDQVNAEITSGYPTIPSQGMASTVNIAAQIDIGGYVIPLGIGVGGESATDMPADESSLQGTATGDTPAAVSSTPGSQAAGTMWFNVQKAVGPVMFHRIGIRYEEDVLWFVLDSALQTGGLTLDLIGAAIGSPLSSFVPQFSLDGLGIRFSSPNFEIAGGFLKIAPAAGVDWEFAGGAVVRSSRFAISALGDYAIMSGVPSMFIFGQVTGAFGGPPAFTVTGLAAGFGYNSNLRVPSPAEVYQFPLVTGAQDPSLLGGPNTTPTTVLPLLLGTWVTHELGQFWFAAGVQFTSFQLVFTNALIVAKFGGNTLFSLTGISRARFPVSGPDTYAFIELQLGAVVDPDQGLFALAASLTSNSYVFDPTCKLTGGFAFYTWFGSNSHAGDFVITVGGYHPSFDPPAWYPQVSPVGFTWALDANVSITGSAYLALTPSAMMAGGQLGITYQVGSLKAWLTAWANMLMYWEPFHFRIDIGVSIGASYQAGDGFVSHTFTAELGADLHLWGPPTGGSATVHWWVISFTIKFGAPENFNPPPLTLTEFLTLLPDNEEIIKIVPVVGLQANSSANLNSGEPWLVRSFSFAFSITSAIPCSELMLGNRILASGDNINIRPMQVQSLNSEQSLTIRFNGTALDLSDGAWTITPVTQNVPKALWGTGTQNQLDPGDAQLLPGQLVGFDVITPGATTGDSPGPIDVETNLRFDELTPAGILPLIPNAPEVGPIAQLDDNTIAVIEDQIADESHTAARTLLFEQLVALGINPLTNEDMTMYAEVAASIFVAEPMIVHE